MRRKALLALVLGLAVGLSANFVIAQGPDSWSVGTHDGDVPMAYQGALEYLSVEQAVFFANGVPSADDQLANGWRYGVFDYTVAGATDGNPVMPGYIGPENVCIFQTSDNRPCTIATMVLNIHFTLQCEYREGELDFLFGRYGSEADDIFIDGISTGPPVDAQVEGNHVDLIFDLPAAAPGGVLSPGSHTISIIYMGGGEGNGHYVDHLELISHLEGCVVDEGRMTGGGSVFTEARLRVTHGFELYCDPADGPNNLEVNWAGRAGRGWGNAANRFHLESLATAACLDTQLEEAPPVAGFDTYTGSGLGRLNGVSGYTADWVFSDAGEPGYNDSAWIVITAPEGNHQAH